MNVGSFAANASEERQSIVSAPNELQLLNNFASDAGPATILLVEDSPILRQGGERTLREEGYQVLLAANGQEALEVLARTAHPPDLIISDIVMPKLNGLELLRAVRQNPAWRAVPFLLLTESDSAEHMRQALLLGADDYLLRPMDRSRLLFVIRLRLNRQAELLESILQQQNALDNAKSELTLMVAHELRTPLVGIQMAAEILSRELDTVSRAQLQEMIEVISAGSTRMHRLVEQAIMFVLLDTGALAESVAEQSRPNPIRDAVVGAIARARQFDYHRKESNIVFNELDAGASVLCDLAALKHAFAELIANANTFARPGSPVQLTQWVSDGRVWLTVTDYGPGIPESELSHVFEPYRQFERRKHEQQGIGVGLVLARGIIEAHGGSFELCSVTDRGTQVIVGLPVYDESALE